MTLSAFWQGPELGPGRLDPIWSGFGLVASRKARPIRLRSARGGPRRPAAAQGGLAAPRSGPRRPSGTPPPLPLPPPVRRYPLPPLPPLPPCHPGFRRDPPTWPEVPAAHQPPCAPLATKSPELPKKWAAIAQKVGSNRSCPNAQQLPKK